MSYSIPHLHVIGTNYQVGYAIGKEFEKRIKTYLDIYDDLKNILLPFTKTEYGLKIVNGFRSRIEESFPWLIDEMQGIADGSQIPFDTILAINLRTELFHLINDKDCDIIDKETIMECSSFSVCNDKSYAVLHNEDASVYVYDTCYFVTSKIISTEYKNGLKSPNEEFTSFTYPGHIAGNAFSFNTSGFTFCVNALYSIQIAINRFPRQIINRLMLSARNLEELERILLFTPIAFSFSMTLGYFGENETKLKSNWTNEFNDEVQSRTDSCVAKRAIWNYELAPDPNSSKKSLVSKHCTIPFTDKLDKSDGFYSFDYFFHFNHFERIKIKEGLVNSSIHRHKRSHEMSPPRCELDLFKFAYDTEDKEYPIFRERNENNSKICCVSTALFNLRDKTLSIYVNRSDLPLMTILLEEKAK